MALEVPKVNYYAVLQTDGVEVTKTNYYAVLETDGVEVTKVVYYAVLREGVIVPQVIHQMRQRRQR